jgi:CRISPR-associated protein Csd1
MEHRKRLEIIDDKGNILCPVTSLRQLLRELDKEFDRDPDEDGKAKVLFSKIIEAVLMGTRYPLEMITHIEQRIHTENEINIRRASIIKAYYLMSGGLPEEVLTMALNENTRNVAYVLGRLFAMLDDINKRANNVSGSESAPTFSDKYFASASSAPATVFPRIFGLMKIYYNKIAKSKGKGLAVYLESKVSELMSMLDIEQLPPVLSQAEKSSFYLGYYHQMTDISYKNK